MLARGIATTALRSDTRIATQLNMLEIASIPIASTVPTATVFLWRLPWKV